MKTLTTIGAVPVVVSPTRVSEFTALYFTSATGVLSATGFSGGTAGVDLLGSTSGSTKVIALAIASGTLTLPAATDTLVGKATTDTLTNKTLNLTSNTLVATSAQLLAAVTDETGTGALVFATSPVLVTPVLGVASATSLELSSTTGALLLTRLTTAQRDALTVANGMVLYNTTTATIQGYQGGAWANL